MSYVVNAFACLVNIEIPGENMKDFVSNHTPDRIQISGGYFCMDTERFSYTCLEVIDLVAYKGLSINVDFVFHYLLLELNVLIACRYVGGG